MNTNMYKEGVAHVKRLQRIVDDLSQQYDRQMVEAMQDPCATEEDVIELGKLILELERKQHG